MTISPLATLRLGSPDSPSLREVSRRVKLSAAYLSLFEQGRAALDPRKMTLYAQAVGSNLAEVRRRFLLARLMHHEQSAKETRRQLAELGVKKRAGRPVKHTA